MKLSRRLRKIMIEMAFLVGMILDLVWWHVWYLTVLSSLYFIYDYISYRREAILSFRASRPVREAMTLRDVKEIENRYTSLEAFSVPEKRAMTRPPLDRYFYYVRYQRAQMLLDKYASGAKRVLDLGCGFGLNTLYVCQNLETAATGVDLDHLKLLEASRRAADSPLCKEVAFVTGDACHPPFKASSFDCILMAEALEHLIRPEKGIAACKDLLCDGGTLILTTPSHHNLNYSSNPLIVLEKLLSLVWDGLLPPYHNLHAQSEYNRKNPESRYGIHYHFSYQNLSTLLHSSGFKSILKGSFEMEIPLFPIIELLFRGELDRIRKFVGPIELVLARLPLVKYLGQHLIWVAQKIVD